jgi:hypothetical protein
MQRWALPRLSHVLFISILAGCLLLGSRMLNTDGDLGRHLTLGTYMLETHRIPVNDVLSFSRFGAARPPYEWLSQIAFAAAYRLLNLDGVVLLASVAIAAAFFVVYVDGAERSQAPFLALCITTWAAVASSLHWLTRPHVFSFILFALWVRCLERLRTGRTVGIWQFPVLMLLWANTHGGFILGILAWLAYLFGWAWQSWRKQEQMGIGGKLVLVGAASLVASILTPDLWGNWGAVLQNRSAFILSRTIETRSLDISSQGTWPFLCMLGLVVLVFAASRRRLIPAHAFLLGGLAAISFSMVRNIPFFAIASAPILIERLATVTGARPRWLAFEKTLLTIDGGLRGIVWPLAAVVFATGLLSVHGVRTHRSLYRFSPGTFPVEAADWLMDHPLAGNMFNDFNWGGYLLYRLWPSQRVFIDSQSDFYGEDFTRQYEELNTAGGNWQQYLSVYKIAWVIVPPSSRLATNLALDPSWGIRYQDSTAKILGRSPIP